MKYRDFVAVIEYSDEDQLYVGKVINSRDIIVFDGADMNEATASFHAVIDEYLDDDRDKKASKWHEK